VRISATSGRFGAVCATPTVTQLPSDGKARQTALPITISNEAWAISLG
jgi:hypothetical protein